MARGEGAHAAQPHPRQGRACVHAAASWHGRATTKTKAASWPSDRSKSSSDEPPRRVACGTPSRTMRHCACPAGGLQRGRELRTRSTLTPPPRAEFSEGCPWDPDHTAYVANDVCRPRRSVESGAHRTPPSLCLRDEARAGATHTESRRDFELVPRRRHHTRRRERVPSARTLSPPYFRPQPPPRASTRAHCRRAPRTARASSTRAPTRGVTPGSAHSPPRRAALHPHRPHRLREPMLQAERALPRAAVSTLPSSLEPPCRSSSIPSRDASAAHAPRRPLHRRRCKARSPTGSITSSWARRRSATSSPTLGGGCRGFTALPCRSRRAPQGGTV